MTPQSSGHRPPTAQHAGSPTADTSGASLLRMAIGDDAVAVSIDDVREILEVGRLTALPRTPDFVRGVMNLRGAVVPVIDLAARLGFDSATPDRRTCVVVVEVPQGGEMFELGLVVDGVSEVLELDAGALEPAPSFGATIRSDFIGAMARIRNHFVIVLRPEQVLSIDEVSNLARVPA